MSNGALRRPAIGDLDLLHNLIEQCLQLHLSKRDAVNLIFREANVDPGYTELVWEQLEQENREFFDCYYVRLALKQQIELFNELLRQQAVLTQEMTDGVAPSPGSNGSHVSGNGSHISENGSGMLGNGYHVSPGSNGFHVSGNGSHISGNASHMSGNGSGMLGNGYHVSPGSNGSHVSGNGSHISGNGSHMSGNGSGMLGNNYHLSDRSHRPNGSHVPENGVHMPENGSHRSANGSHRPENGSQRLENGSHGPINGSYRAENISHRTVNGSYGPVNGSYMQPLAQNGGCYRTDEAGPSTRARNLQPAMSSNVPSSASTGGMSVLQMPTPFDLSTSSTGIDFLPKYNTLHVHSSNSTELIQGLNGEVIKPGSDYSDSQAIFQTYGDVGTRASVEEVPFSCVEASSPILSESLLAMNGSSFGQFGQIPENFSLSDLSTAYPSETENYANSSFGTTIAGSFFVSQDVVEVPKDTSGVISESYNS